MKPVIELLRREENEKYGTFGILTINKEVFCVTLEPPDRENKQRVSSIPAQQYTCQRHISPAFGETFMVMNVPDRTHVLFHPGNWVKDTLGCIVLAQYFGKLRGDRAVLNSGKTFKAFMELLKPFDDFSFTVVEHYG